MSSADSVLFVDVVVIFKTPLVCVAVRQFLSPTATLVKHLFFQGYKLCPVTAWDTGLIVGDEFCQDFFGIGNLFVVHGLKLSLVKLYPIDEPIGKMFQII